MNNYLQHELQRPFAERYADLPTDRYAVMPAAEVAQHPFVTLKGYNAEKQTLLVSPSGKYPIMELAVTEGLAAVCKAYATKNNLQQDQLEGLRLVLVIRKASKGQSLPDKLSSQYVWSVLPAR